MVCVLRYVMLCLFFLSWVCVRSDVVHSGDSIKDGSVAICTPHTSFEDPLTPKDAKGRESIELRALVFYDHWSIESRCGSLRLILNVYVYASMKWVRSCWIECRGLTQTWVPELRVQRAVRYYIQIKYRFSIFTLSFEQDVFRGEAIERWTMFEA